MPDFDSPILASFTLPLDVHDVVLPIFEFYHYSRSVTRRAMGAISYACHSVIWPPQGIPVSRIEPAFRSFGVYTCT